jgi:tetratricopeptide (TPR) repeat protein/transcriptional regulator with XRE-family HTH domain
MPTFGQLLRQHREAAYLTQEDLAAKTALCDRKGQGISVRTIQELERGTRGARGGLYPRTLWLLTAALTLADADRATFVAASRQPAARPSPPPPSDLARLPLPEPFIGRDQELAWLLDRLRLGKTTSLTALGGMGGIGKTALAAVAAWQLAREGCFPDGLVVVRCEGVREPVDVLSAILTRFDARLPRHASLAHLVDHAVQLLTGKEVLVVLDNLEPDLALDEVIPALRAAGATLLLTARHQLPRTVVAACDCLRLKLLPPEQAVDLFVDSMAPGMRDTACGRDRKGAGRIVAALGCHTLAVKLAGAYAGDVRLDLTAFAEELTHDPLDLPAGETPQAVKHIFTRSLQALSVGAADLFAALAAFGTAECGRGAVLALGKALDIAASKQVLDLLVLRAFVEPAFDQDMPAGSDRERVRLHPLLRALAREHFLAWSKPRRQAAFRALGYYYGRYVTGDAGKDPARIRDEGNIINAMCQARADGQDEIVYAITYGMRAYWRDRWRLNDGTQYLQWGMEAAEAIAAQRQDRDAALQAADAALAFGQMVSRLGRDADAEHAVQRNLAIRDEWNDLPGKAKACFSLGKLKLLRELYSEGEALLGESLRLRREVLVDDARDHYEDYRVLGRLAKCREPIRVLESYYTGALDVARRWRHRLSEGSALLSLGQIALLCQEYAMAQQYYEEALVIFRAEGDVHFEGGLLGALADVALLCGRLDEAEHHARRSRRILQSLRDQGNLSAVLRTWGHVHEQRGHLDAARAKYSQAYALARELQDQRGKGIVLVCVARLAKRRQDVDEAERAYRKGLRLLEAARSFPEMAQGSLALGRLLLEKRDKQTEGRAYLRAARDWYTALEVRWQDDMAI